MKIKALLIGVCLLTVLAGCDKPQSNDVITTAENTIKDGAAASIKAQYPDVNSSDLKFTRLIITVGIKGEQNVWVSFDLPSSAETTTDGNKSRTTTKEFRVKMSLSGKVEDVHQSTRTDTHYWSQPTKPMINTAPEPTPTNPSVLNSP
jgi:hypothetical protein